MHRNHISPIAGAQLTRPVGRRGTSKWPFAPFRLFSHGASPFCVVMEAGSGASARVEAGAFNHVARPWGRGEAAAGAGSAGACAPKPLIYF